MELQRSRNAASMPCEAYTLAEGTRLTVGAFDHAAKEKEWEKEEERERALQLSDEQVQDPSIPSKVKAQVPDTGNTIARYYWCLLFVLIRHGKLNLSSILSFNQIEVL